MHARSPPIGRASKAVEAFGAVEAHLVWGMPLGPGIPGGPALPRSGHHHAAPICAEFQA
jgi:hypothetical protein